MSKVKLKDLLSEAFEDTPRVDKQQTIEGVRNFGIVGKSLYNNGNIMEIAKQLSDIAESAHNHILGEQDDWFDKISVNKNMKTLKGSVVEFQKAAKEAHQLNQRMTALYEDIGHVLNRYYDIDEALDPVDTSKVEPDDDFEDRDDKDFSLVVTSSGVGNPLKNSRQFLKNIGRKLKVELLNGSSLQGLLDGADDFGFTLKWKQREPKPIGKGKRTVEKKEKLSYNEVIKTIVLV